MSPDPLDLVFEIRADFIRKNAEVLADFLNWTPDQQTAALERMKPFDDDPEDDNPQIDTAPPIVDANYDLAGLQWFGYEEETVSAGADVGALPFAIGPLHQVIPQLREIGAEVVKAGGHANLTNNDRRLLERLANSAGERVLLLGGLGADGTPRTSMLLTQSRWFLAVSIARGICAVIAGEVQVRRCPAPEPGHSDPARKCGKYFVSGGKIGRPAKFCCENCGKRDSRVRKRVRERGGVRGN